MFPLYSAAVVPSYNLPGVKQGIRFTPEALAGIYLGTITRWDDPELVRANPGAHLPAHELTVVFRADSSGTTYIWTDYLTKVSADWSKRVGRGTSVTFPPAWAPSSTKVCKNSSRSGPTPSAT